MAERGLFIVFEGIDGSGKTTHIDLLGEELEKRGYGVLKTMEPTKGRIGALIRKYAEAGERSLSPEAEALLFAADRFEHGREIEEALERGRVVLSDRYLHSTLAYQGAAGVSLGWIREMNRFALKPDLTILLDIDPDASLGRVRGRRRTVFERNDYLRGVRELYLSFAEAGELVRIDASRPVGDVHREVLARVEELLDRAA